MQIRLTVLGPGPVPQVPERASDVLVTAPAGTALAAVAPALAAAIGGGEGQPVLYAGGQRLDSGRSVLGEPPLTDGAVLCLGSVGEAGPDLAAGAAQLHVVAGPDAGGVHLLHGGQILVGRSAEADVPLDDPDVSRLHCAVTVAEDGSVTATDLGSTNGTLLDGRPVGPDPVPLAPGGLLRLGESALRLTPAGDGGPVLGTAADGEGHLRLPEDRGTRLPRPRGESGSGASEFPPAGPGSAGTGPAGPEPWGPRAGTPRPDGSAPRVPQARTPGEDGRGAGYAAPPPPGPGTAPTGHGYGDSAWDEPGPDSTHTVPYQGGPPGAEGDRRDTPVPRGVRRRGLAGWARRFAGGGGPQEPPAAEPAARDHAFEEGPPPGPAGPEPCPDPAALLLTALGPGPRLWERDPEHPQALTVRLGLGEAPGGRRPVPVTLSLREAGSLGLAGPRERVTGLARAVLAQLAALHAPEDLQIVLLSTDRARGTAAHLADWAWLGWLPHLRPAHGQDCRLLLAFDREQATARTGELLRRLDDLLAGHTAPQPPRPAADDAAGHLPDGYAATANGPGTASSPGAHGPGTGPFSAAHSPGATGPGTAPGGSGLSPAPSALAATVVVVDGDPGSVALREAVTRLAAQGALAGIHVLCLATTPPASAASPLHETYESACTASPAFRACGAAALLTGEVATALRLLHPAPRDTGRTGAAGQGLPGTLDAVSAAWADRFARALAPLRTEGSGGSTARISAPLPQVARLLDELGLARATPASLMARWAAAADDTSCPGGRALAVLGAGPRGPVPMDLVAEGPHAVVEGPAGSGRSEVLRAVAASLAAAERPDRLAMVLVDGRDGTAGPAVGEGLRVCTDLPHVTTHLTANDPVRMREFAQALTAELKRRAGLLGLNGFAHWHGGRKHAPAAPARRGPESGAREQGRAPAGTGTVEPPAGPRVPGARRSEGGEGGRAVPAAGEVDGPPSTTLRLRPAPRAAEGEQAAPLPRLVVLVDDVDALLAPPLGSPGRPAAGSVIRALEAVAREGERLGVHLVASGGERLSGWAPAAGAALRLSLDAPAPGPEDPAPGRGRLHGPDGRTTPLQAGRVTGRIPRTATLRPTVVPLEWERMGDPPARRPVRELGNGPTDLALLASALERAARSVQVRPVPSLL
ncbi:FHA domain-containing protein [Streptomyces physcomitrii]|uniref:FHA domain-containing protein n=1 Tax=Streptomyces physcomitrii TaxID=2724184 RepID=UPI0033CA01C5